MTKTRLTNEMQLSFTQIKEYLYYLSMNRSIMIKKSFQNSIKWRTVFNVLRIRMVPNLGFWEKVTGVLGNDAGNYGIETPTALN